MYSLLQVDTPMVETSTATESSSARVAFRANRRSLPATKLWGMMALVVCGLVFVAVVLLRRGEMRSMIEMDGLPGVLLVAMLACLPLFPSLIVEGTVDDRGIRGRSYYRRPIDIAWADVSLAKRGVDRWGRPTSLLIHTANRRRYMLWSGSAAFTPEMAAAVEQLRQHGLELEKVGVD